MQTWITCWNSNQLVDLIGFDFIWIYSDKTEQEHGKNTLWVIVGKQQWNNISESINLHKVIQVYPEKAIHLDLLSVHNNGDKNFVNNWLM